LEEYDKALFQTDSVALLNENNSACIKVLDKSFDKIHKGTILSINFDHSGDILFTTSSDKVITAFTIEGELIAVSTTLEAPIISFSLHPIIPNLFVFGCMDFSHGLLVFDEDNKISKFNILKKWKLHEKYIINVKWSPDGNFFVAASRDGKFSLFKLDHEKYEDSIMILSATIGECIEAITFTNDSKYIVTTSREDNYLHYINIESNTFTEQLFNMNNLGDDYVSFNVLDIKCAPDGNILVCTDNNRAILFQLLTPIQKRNFYGFMSDHWSLPRSIFSKNGEYLYVTSQDNSVYVYSTLSEKFIVQLKEHTGIVRDLCMHPTLNLLVTCSYDKTVKIWKV